MKTSGFMLVAAALLVSSCVPTMQVDSLLKEVQDNQIAALDEYEGKQVRVTGTVEATGLKSFNETVSEGGFAGTNVGGGLVVGRMEGTSRTETKQSPFVSLKSDASVPGNVVCFFSDDNRRAAAQARVGEMVTLQGQVYRVKGSSRYAIVLMSDCDVIR